MGNPVVANIILGGARVWYAPVGETKPDETSVAFGAAWGGNWARVGFTTAPLALGMEEERARIMVQEHLSKVKSRRIQEDCFLETRLGEMDLNYLVLALGGTVSTTAAGASQVGYDELQGGDIYTCPEYAWGFEGEYVDASGNSYPIRFFIHKGQAQLNGNLEWDNHGDAEVGIPLRIEAYTDPSQSAGQRLYIWQKVTDPATS